jgi:DNA-binding NarL/FixJ family response regulator
MQKLNISYGNLNQDIIAIYKHHGITNLKKKAKAALAVKLSLAPPLSQREQTLQKVQQLYQQGMNKHQIAKELLLSPITIKPYLKKIRDKAKTDAAATPSR